MSPIITLSHCRETKIDQLERQLKEKEKEVQKLKDQKMLYMEQLEEAQKDIANFENRWVTCLDHFEYNS